MAAQLRDLVENKLAQSVSQAQDRPGVLAFYKARDFAPIWTASGKLAPRAQQAASFLQGVAADGLDPADYPAPKFDNADPVKLAADELAMTNSVVTFARHASIGRVAFTRERRGLFRSEGAECSRSLSKLADSDRRSRDARCIQSAAPGLQGAQGAACRGAQRPSSEVDNNRGL